MTAIWYYTAVGLSKIETGQRRFDDPAPRVDIGTHGNKSSKECLKRTTESS